MSQKIELAACDITAAGNGPAMGIPFMNSVGHITVYIAGTFGGTAAKVQVSADGVNWFDAPAPNSITAPGYIVLVSVLTRFVRVVATGGTGISLNVKVLF